jgi:hypothetical protein
MLKVLGNPESGKTVDLVVAIKCEMMHISNTGHSLLQSHKRQFDLYVSTNFHCTFCFHFVG